LTLPGLHRSGLAVCLKVKRSDLGVRQQKTRRALFSAGLETSTDYLGQLNGAGERNRTLDLLITSELLYQLSYTGMGSRGEWREAGIV
jgi:hypothetical protein